MADSFDGGGGIDTLYTMTNAADFRGSTITSFESFDNTTTATFFSRQLDGSTFDNHATLNVYVDELTHNFSLRNVSVGPVTGTANLLLNDYSGTVNIFADNAGDTIIAGVGIENITDGMGADTILAGTGADTVNITGGGADQIFGRERWCVD